MLPDRRPECGTCRALAGCAATGSAPQACPRRGTCRTPAGRTLAGGTPNGCAAAGPTLAADTPACPAPQACPNG